MKYIKLFEAFIAERIKAPKALEEIIKGNTSRWEGIKISKDLADHYMTWLRTSPWGKKQGSDLPLDAVIKASFSWGIERGLDPKLKPELDALKSSIKESVNEAVFSEFSNSELADIEKDWEHGSAIKAINAISKKLHGKDITKLNLSKQSQDEFDDLYNNYLSGGRKKAATTLIAIYKLLKESFLDEYQPEDWKNEDEVTEGFDVKELTKDATMKIAQLYAKAISKADGTKCTVNQKSVEPGSFDLDCDGIEYDGGSYYIDTNGDVINAAISGKPVYGKWNDTVDVIVRNVKKL